MTTIKTENIRLINSLPPLVACLAWDALNEKVSEQTIMLARSASDEEYKRFTLVRLIASTHPQMVEHIRDIAKMTAETMQDECEVTP